ncbi:Acetylornithine deacetylase/Succinyl-diaminopimelate desuccinylase [Frankineae bacterium MT45]|nr:Acetylornithine deacetylase/Succinyl-diaminopimelate desuccinylase [Frankineae bacterium MT45]
MDRGAPAVGRLRIDEGPRCSEGLGDARAGRATSVEGMTTVREFIADHRDDLLRDLDEWLRIPGISAQPAHHGDVMRSAQWFAAAATRTGFPTVEVWPTAGMPTVFAEWPSDDPDAPTVVVYGHHDVQPVDPIDLWSSDPFDPTIDGDVLRARGASDDKGQLLFHLLAVRAHLAATGRTSPQVNLKLLIEGEEESGSPNFENLLAERRDRLQCDVVVITDTGMLAADIPSTVTGMRGLVAATVHFHGPDLDLHSGVFGGAVPNPATAIAALVAALHDDGGRVLVPGFYDEVLTLNETERALFAKVPFAEGEFLGVAKSRSLAGESGYSTLERLGARPTAEVNGIGGGYQGDGGKTIVPSDAFAKLSFRLVANQVPATIRRAVDAFVADHTPEGIEARVEWDGDGVAPCLVPLGTPAYEALVAAIAEAFDGAEVLPTREGGSGPEAAIQQALGVPLVFLGVGLPDDQIHAPNEKVNLSMLYKGAEIAATLWARFAAVGPAALRDVTPRTHPTGSDGPR